MVLCPDSSVLIPLSCFGVRGPFQPSMHLLKTESNTLVRLI